MIINSQNCELWGWYHPQQLTLVILYLYIGIPYRSSVPCFPFISFSVKQWPFSFYSNCTPEKGYRMNQLKCWDNSKSNITNDFKCLNKSLKVTRYLDFITFGTEDVQIDLKPPENGNEKWFLYFYNFEKKRKKKT